MNAAVRQDIEFRRGDLTISAWHYPPCSDALRNEKGVPAVILGHGYGLTRDCGL